VGGIPLSCVCALRQRLAARPRLRVGLRVRLPGLVLVLAFMGAALSCVRAEPPPGFTLKMGVLGGVGEVTPDAHSGGAALATDLVFETLARPEPGGWSSRFLRRWERVGPRRWRLDILPGARFSDGTAVLPDDIAETIQRKGIRVLELTTSGLLVETMGPDSLERELALTAVARQAGGRYLGTGPFAVTSLQPDRLVLTRVQPVPGRIARVEFVACATGREALVRLLRGELGAIPSMDPVGVELLDGVPTLRIIRSATPHAIAILLNPRLPASERRALASSLPLPAIAAALRHEPCCAGGPPERRAPPPGRPLSIGYPRSGAFRRAALALRQGLGPRGGEVTPFEVSELTRRAPELDLLTTSVLVRPPGVLARYLRTGAEWNFQGYSNPSYDAALAAGDEEAAAKALADDPSLVVVARRERVGAVDARLANAQLGDWGLLDLLPEWEVSP